MGRKHKKPSRNKQLRSFSLSFGKYAGKPLQSIPRDYLEWMVAAPRIPAADVWAAKQFLRLSSRRPTYRPAAVNRCVNDVKGAEEQSPEVSIGKPETARTLCSTLPLDGRNGELLAGIAPTEDSTVKPLVCLAADQNSTASG